MAIVKKLIFAPFFLAIFFILLSSLSSLTKSYDFIFSFSLNSFIQLIIISALLPLSSLLFVVFATLSSDWKINLPVGILASLIPLFFWETGLAIIFSVLILINLLITFLNLGTTLKNYLTFSPNSIFSPLIRNLSGLLILSICIIYFFSASKTISEKGFKIPDSLIESALKLTPMPQLSNQQETSMPQITNDQINLLKKNPNLLKQSGLDPKILDTLDNQSKNPLEDTIKQTVKDQFESLIKPYTSFLPVILAILLFFTLSGLTSLTNLFVYPILWLTFYILEKTNLISFTTEQRPVKKLVV